MTSVMLHRVSMHGLSKADTLDPLMLMRLVCTRNARIAAAAMKQQPLHIQPSIEQVADPALDIMEMSHPDAATSATNSAAACNQPDTVGVGAKADTGSTLEEEYQAPQSEAPAAGSSQQMAFTNGDACQIHLAVAFTAFGETTLQHKHVIDMRMVQAEATQAQVDQEAAAKAQQKQKDCADKSLVACVQSQKENLELETERLENQVQNAMQPMMAGVTTLCQSKALFRTNKTLRASALLSLMKMMCAHKSVCEEKIFLPLLFTCLGPGHRCEQLVGRMLDAPAHLRIEFG